MSGDQSVSMPEHVSIVNKALRAAENIRHMRLIQTVTCREEYEETFPNFENKSPKKCAIYIQVRGDMDNPIQIGIGFNGAVDTSLDLTVDQGSVLLELLKGVYE